MNPYQPPEDDGPPPRQMLRVWWSVLGGIVLLLLLAMWLIQAWHMFVPDFGFFDVEFGPVP
ncbi:hypothetical protein Mal15_57940 [Stieleria maiorica]|uniref:Uncharacterized protein n=1 Tax=Stieleria maiorica TaxID=2795974 RepID=A0A5B9MPW0_9BACT|nr:hypothetical protein [Stieleria maiorica]QEG01716.1 hypothetical protein Mal15_57940 [Stieleria maiorica]